MGNGRPCPLGHPCAGFGHRAAGSQDRAGLGAAQLGDPLWALEVQADEVGLACWAR